MLKTHITRTEVKESMYLEQTENQMGKVLQENERLQQVIKSNMLHISQLVQNHDRLKKDHGSSLKEFDCQLECLITENRKLVKMVYLMKREIDQNRIAIERLNSTIEL